MLKYDCIPQCACPLWDLGRTLGVTLCTMTFGATIRVLAWGATHSGRLSQYCKLCCEQPKGADAISRQMEGICYLTFTPSAFGLAVALPNINVAYFHHVLCTAMVCMTPPPQPLCSIYDVLTRIGLWQAAHALVAFAPTESNPQQGMTALQKPCGVACPPPPRTW